MPVPLWKQRTYSEFEQERAEALLPGAKQNAPLGDLAVDQYTYASFTYPLDLGAPGAGNDHYVVFHINETSTTNFLTRTAGNSNPLDQSNRPVDLPTRIGNARNDQEIDRAYARQAEEAARRNGTSTTGKDGGSARPTGFQAIKQNIQRVATTIVLYTPGSITMNFSADWTPEDLGVAKDLADWIAKDKSLKEVFESMGVSTLQGLGRLANEFTGLSLKEALGQKGRLAVNNHPEVIFNGVGFRRFQFHYRFTPQTPAEAINIDNIIRAFKFYAAPEILQGTAGRFWIYPAEFDIQYYSNGQENQFLNKISTCALTDISVNYTPMGHWSAHRPTLSTDRTIQGSPSVCTDMTLQFCELEIMTKRRILQGY